MALSAGESFSGGQVRDSKSRSVVISETTNAALSAGEFYSGGFLCDADSRTVICQDTVHSALSAGEQYSAGDVRDKVGRIVCATETANSALSAGSVFSGGWLRDSQGRRIIALDTLGAALSAGEQFTAGQVRDSAGRLVVASESAGPTTYDGTVLADTPVAFWKMNEPSGTTIVDSVGANPGTYSGAFTLAQPGPCSDGETSVLFDGITGKGDVPTSAALNPAQVSLECWIYYPLTPGGFPTHAGKYTASTGYMFWANSTSLNFQTNAASVTDPGTLSSLTWYHIVGTFDGTQLRLYRNGVLTAGPSAGTLSSTAAGFTIAYQSTNFFAGRVAKVAVYNYALSLAQVQAHYAAR